MIRITHCPFCSVLPWDVAVVVFVYVCVPSDFVYLNRKKKINTNLNENIIKELKNMNTKVQEGGEEEEEKLVLCLLSLEFPILSRIL